MISLNWDNSDVSLSKNCFDLVCNLDYVVSHFLNIIVTFVVGRVVSGQEHHVRLYFRFNVVKHSPERLDWNVTQISTPFTCGDITRLYCLSIRLMATQISRTVHHSSFSIQVIQVRVRNVNCEVSLAKIWICSDLCIHLVDKVIVTNVQWLCCKNFTDNFS